MIHVNITVTGRVQRIGFRFSSMQTAVNLGICGFIMNVDNDKVYIEAEGEEAAIEKFVEWCKVGPAWSKVTQISVDKGDLKNFTSYEILSR
jgi:acylphosphatase